MRRMPTRNDDVAKQPVAAVPPFVVQAKDCGFRSGVDSERLSQLSDELEIESFERKLGRAMPKDEGALESEPPPGHKCPG